MVIISNIIISLTVWRQVVYQMSLSRHHLAKCYPSCTTFTVGSCFCLKMRFNNIILTTTQHLYENIYFFRLQNNFFFQISFYSNKAARFQFVNKSVTVNIKMPTHFWLLLRKNTKIPNIDSQVIESKKTVC